MKNTNMKKNSTRVKNNIVYMTCLFAIVFFSLTLSDNVFKIVINDIYEYTTQAGCNYIYKI